MNSVCYICKRRHDNIGINFNKLMCLRCLKHIKKVKLMATRELDVYERNALEAAGDAGGMYLDSLGKTDLLLLEPEEWREFWKRGLFGYERAMKKQLEEIPF